MFGVRLMSINHAAKDICDSSSFRNLRQKQACTRSTYIDPSIVCAYDIVVKGNNSVAESESTMETDANSRTLRAEATSVPRLLPGRIVLAIGAPLTASRDDSMLRKNKDSKSNTVMFAACPFTNLIPLITNSSSQL